MAHLPLYDIRITTSRGVLMVNRVHEIELEENWQNLSNTGTLKLPRKSFGKNFLLPASEQIPITQLIKTGDKVVVRLGYMGNGIAHSQRFVTEFIGYVSTSPQPFAPVEISLENEMYKLKRKQVVTKTFKGSAKVADVIKYVAPEYTADVVDAELSKNFIVPTGSAAQALMKIEELYAIKSFFRLVPDSKHPDGARNVLVVGKPYQSKDLLALAGTEDMRYAYRENVISSSLKWQAADEKRVKIQVPVKLTNGKDYTYQTGDEDGTIIKTQELTNVSDAYVKQFAADRLKQYKVDRFTGDLTSFGFPFVRSGRIVTYSDWRFGFKDARYFVDTVKVNSGVNGYRRIVTLGWLATAANNSRKV